MKAASQQTSPATRKSVRAKAFGGVVLAIVVAAGAVGVGGMSGCYRRVVGARGIGADQYEVSEPYQSDTRVDRWFYGSESRRGGSKLP